MTGREWDIPNQRLTEVLEQEFGITVNLQNPDEVLRARDSVAVYESAEEYLKSSGWERNNPEIASEEYLVKNRICRWIDGKFIYFSTLLWETGKAGSMV